MRIVFHDYKETVNQSRTQMLRLRNQRAGSPVQTRDGALGVMLNRDSGRTPSGVAPTMITAVPQTRYSRSPAEFLYVAPLAGLLPHPVAAPARGPSSPGAGIKRRRQQAQQPVPGSRQSARAMLASPQAVPDAKSVHLNPWNHPIRVRLMHSLGPAEVGGYYMARNPGRIQWRLDERRSFLSSIG